MSTIEIFSKNLRYYRLEYNNINNIGISQEKLAELTGFSTHYISDVERGCYSPTFEALDILSKTLKISVDKFFIEDSKIMNLPGRVDIYRKSKHK